MKNNILIFTITFFVTILSAQERPASSTERGAKPLQLQTGNLIMPASSYAVVIGISDYQDKDIPDLQFADKDAEVFANFLRSNAGGKLDNDHLKVLLNADATMAQFAIALDWLMEVVKENDQVIIYFSGHGDVEKKTITQPGYLLCWDSPSRVYLAGGALALPMFQDIITTLSSQNKAKVIVITDACRSGKLAGSSVGGSQITGANLAKQYSNELKILSCQPNEYSIEGEQWGGGRGAFSYHLVNALYGLADNNNDDWVTVQEVGRYLEDHVTKEVAPMSQVPVIIGNRTEKISGVDDKILADIRAGKSNEMVLLSSIESKGIEEQVMAGVDTTLKQLYQFFKKAIKDKKLVEPLNAPPWSGQGCADIYYEQLIKEPKLERLHSTMKRNYAAALQDDAQQAMNIWLKADVQQMECIGKSLKLEPIPRQLKRAAELLGEGHYMYRSLLARELLFEGIILSETNKNPNEVLGQKCLSMFRDAMQLEPQSPLTWYNMSLVYLHNLRQPDSAFMCVREANILAPNWVLPYADLGYILYNLHFEDEMAREALSKAEAIDAAHPFVINRMAGFYVRQGKHQTALEMFERYREAGGIMYPCWHNDYSLVLKELGRLADAESEMLKAIALDSTKKTSWINLGQIYLSTRRFTQAESVLKKGIALDSTYITGWSTLGHLYHNSGQNIEAEKIYKKVISLDSTTFWVWSSLGNVYMRMQRYVDAENTYKKAITLDSMSFGSWSNLGNVYTRMKRNVEAENAFKKAITLDSTFSVAWNGLGLLYTNMRRYAESELILKNAISLDSTKTQALGNLGYLYNITRRFAEAEPVWKKIISLDSTIVWAWGNLGYAYLYAHRFAESEVVYKKAVLIDSNRAIYWVELGEFYLYLHRYSEAESVLQKAISLDSSLASAHKALGTFNLRIDDLEKARLEFLKAQKLSSNYFGSYLGMAYLFAREGKFVEAFAQLEQALQKCALHHLVIISEDEDLASLRHLPQWNDLMKKYFPENVK